jgi:hypothetical protein
VSTVAAPVNASEALEMVRAGMGFLAAADATAMPAALQAQCLQGLEEVDSVEAVARASVLRAFSAGQGYCDDGEFSAKTWLVHRTRVSRGAAAGHMKWARRAAAHPVVAAALAGAVVSESWARVICEQTGRLPAASRDEADAILLAAVAGGAVLEDLAALGQRMYEMSRSATPDSDSGAGGDGAGAGGVSDGEGAGAGEEGDAGEGSVGGDGAGFGAGAGLSGGDGGGDAGPVFDDRSVRLSTTFGGAAVLAGDLTPECAAAVEMVLDALSARAGADDTRTREQRRHDALQEAMRWLVAAGMVPDRAGQPAKVVAHIALPDLLELDGGSARAAQWAEQVRARWAAARAAAAAVGGDGGVWLEGEAAQGFACDAGITPVVIGEVNLAALDALVRLCQELGGHGPGRCQPRHTPAESSPGDSPCDPAGTTGSGPVPPTERGRAALERAIIGKAAELLSGPGGLASFLRRGLLGARLGGPSLPLDVGWSENIPAGIRNAVLIRDRHCRWPGGCSQPAKACHVHHVRHKGRGGKTSITNCVLLCAFHHLVAIHRWGWTLALNGDGTTTAWNKDHTQVLHSHAPPTTRAG